MKIKNIKLKALEARRFVDTDEKPRQIRIDHNSQITRVQNQTDQLATIEFQYTASYGPIGMIKIEGVISCEQENAQQLSQEWYETRKIPDNLASTVHTAVMHACVPEAVGLAKNLGLPPPIPLPQVRLGATSKQAQSGPEIA